MAKPLSQKIMLLVDADLWWKLGSTDPTECLSYQAMDEDLQAKIDERLYEAVWTQVKHGAGDAVHDHVRGMMP